MLCYAVVCFVFCLHYEITTEVVKRGRSYEHIQVSMYPSVFPNSCSLYNLQHNTRTWKLTWVPGGPVVLCHFIPCAHLCDHRYQNTELFNHHEDLPHAASLWYIHSPLRLPPLGVSSLATTNLSPISVILSFREQYVDEFHSV